MKFVPRQSEEEIGIDKRPFMYRFMDMALGWAD